jgi:hypothetical protein
MGKVLRLQKGASEDSGESPLQVAISLERYEFLRSNGHPHSEVA